MSPEKPLVYFDNAATSWPKPPRVYQEVERVMKEIGANPGRSSHFLAQEAGRLVFEARETVARFFKISNSENIFFTSSATESLNLALKGYLKPNEEVIISALEHNSVRRPLTRLKEIGVKTVVIGANPQGEINLSELPKAITKKTALIAITGASNVIGTLTPLKEIAEIASKAQIPLLVDGAQICGVIPIDVEALGIDMLASSGHKGLLGPAGTGFLYVKPGLELKPLLEGGTGSSSESEEQPSTRPDRYESGTLNFPGLAGLKAGLEYLEEQGLLNIRETEKRLTAKLIKGLQKLDKVIIYGPLDVSKKAPVLSFNIENRDPAEVGQILDEEYGILSRVGLHCAPTAHKVLGTFPQGTIRFSLGPFNRETEIDYALASLAKIIKG